MTRARRACLQILAASVSLAAGFSSMSAPRRAEALRYVPNPLNVAQGFRLAPLALEQATQHPYGRIAKGKFQKFVSQNGNFELEYPSGKNWKVVPGHPDAVLTLIDARTGKASMVVERVALRGALTPDEITASAADEVKMIRDRQAGATNINQKVQDAEGRRFIVVQYSRPGPSGPEQVVLYTFPIGTSMYRLICSAAQPEFAKYATVFGHAAATFRPTPPAPSKH